MYNKITLIGSVAKEPDEPDFVYYPAGNKYYFFYLKVPPPPDAPPTYWSLTFDMRDPDWETGDDTFLVICQARVLDGKSLQSLQEGDVVCVEGRLVLTPLRSDGDLVPLA